MPHIFQSRDNVLFLLGLLVSSHRRGRKSFFQRSVGKLVWQSDSANQVLIHDAERHIRQRRENRHSLNWLAGARELRHHVLFQSIDALKFGEQGLVSDEVGQRTTVAHDVVGIHEASP